MIKFSSLFLSGPSPYISKMYSGYSIFISLKPAIKKSNPFDSSNRPTLVMRFSLTSGNSRVFIFPAFIALGIIILFFVLFLDKTSMQTLFEIQIHRQIME